MTPVGESASQPPYRREIQLTEPRGTGPHLPFTDPQVNLYAPDLDDPLRFYRDVLGFTEGFRTPKEGAPDHVELRLAALRLGLARYDALARQHGLRAGRGPARGEIVLFADDVDGAYGWATSRGATALSAPHDFQGTLRNAAVADPTGNPVVFTARLPVERAPDPGHRPRFQNHLYNLYTAASSGRSSSTRAFWVDRKRSGRRRRAHRTMWSWNSAPSTSRFRPSRRCSAIMAAPEAAALRGGRSCCGSTTPMRRTLGCGPAGSRP